MNVITLIICKLAMAVLKLTGRGSSFPGELALKLNKKILKYFKLPDRIIAVTGSSGKGSCSSVIAKCFRDQGYKVAHNSSGSNLTAGITALLISRSKLNGRIKDDVLVMEVDERYAKFIFKDIKPDTVVITNLTKDQPPRQGHVDLVYHEINKALKEDMTLILNGDDPYTRKFALKREFKKVLYFGIDKTADSYTESRYENLIMYYCPKCNKRLDYNYRHIEIYGDYSCPGCDFKRPDIDYRVTKADFDKKEITINGHDVKLPYGMLFGVYNAAAIYACCASCGLDEDKTAKSLSEEKADKHIYSEYKQGGRNVYVLNNKNENSATFNQSVWFYNRGKGSKSVIIGWREISRRYGYDDLSWLYDISFELLDDGKLDYVVASGTHAEAVKKRMELAGISDAKIVCEPELSNAVDFLKSKTKSDIYAILNFDYVEPFNTLMGE
ncbi:MAG: DUF1727 domain-containing protein [Lachnospiraceae bacterium]|nr:DUF1727 domain-containing protein [Lachnospiraceae bacterium]